MESLQQASLSIGLREIHVSTTNFIGSPVTNAQSCLLCCLNVLFCYGGTLNGIYLVIRFVLDERAGLGQN